MAVVKVAVRLAGLKNSYIACNALVDIGARMNLMDRV